MKVDFAKLERAFNPKCIAVIGDKGPNFQWSKSQSDFKGSLYSVQIDPKEIEGIVALGVTNYTSLMDIPEPVDLAIVAVPREITPRIIEDLIRKDVAAAHFYTAGFSETHTEEGIKLERLLVERAEQANLHLIGPNCMGVRNPRAGVGQLVKEQSGPFAGSLGFISQSGMNAGALIREAQQQGVNTHKSVSFGNGVILDSTDYLEYFGQDTEITGIGMYVDGVRDGRRFLRVLREVSARKPVVIWKGGRTHDGQRAAASHTDSMAVPQEIWEAGLRQCGAINAYSVEELMDILKGLQYFSPVHGDGVAITGGSGGQSIVVADVFSEAGLRVPELTRESFDEFGKFFTLIGGAFSNPIDTANENRSQMTRILEILEKDANIDNMVLIQGARAGSGPQFEAVLKSLTDIRKRGAKPVMVVLSVSFSPEEAEQAGDTIQKFQEKGIATFLSLERGARALRKALDYYNWKNGVTSS